ncbi:hypothetical protein BJY00DRAFT_284495 [Aspergillus carlsbadensis]|nr:hypothetical protein BJY00DRAFT_284495 [Aspergillus carlsbadensis]
MTDGRLHIENSLTMSTMMSTTTTIEAARMSVPTTMTEPNDEKQTTPDYMYPPIAEPTLLRTILTQDIYILGGLFTILTQLAHPALAAGSYNHSQFAYRFQQRLQRTACFLNVAVNGSDDEKRAMFAVVHKYHSRVKGDGYTADDPELHKWTAATLFVAIVRVRETFVGKMSHDEMEGLFRECAIFGTSLRMPPEMWPTTLDEFWAYWDYSIATLTISDQARSLARGMLYPPMPLPMSVAWVVPVVRTLTVNWLPDRLAREYNVQPTLANRAAYVGIVSWVKTVYPFVPLGLRGRLARENLEDGRRAVVKIQETGHWSTK